MQVQVRSVNPHSNESSQLTPNSHYHKVASAVITSFNQMTAEQPLVPKEVESQLSLAEQIDQKEIDAFSILDKKSPFPSSNILTIGPFANIHLETETSGVEFGCECESKTEKENNPQSLEKTPTGDTEIAMSLVATHLAEYQKQHKEWTSEKINVLLDSLKASQQLAHTFQQLKRTFQNTEIHKQASMALLEKEEASLLAKLLRTSSIKINPDEVAGLLIHQPISKLASLTTDQLAKILNINVQIANEVKDFFNDNKIHYFLIGAWLIKNVLKQPIFDIDLIRLAADRYSYVYERPYTFLENERRFANRLEAVMTAIHIGNLKAGERYIRPGGWKGSNGSSGHAMIEIYERRTDGNFDILILNTGGGIEYHTFLKDDAKGKLRIQSVVKFENVLPSELCLSENPDLFSPQFFENLIALNNPIADYKIGSEAIYEKAFGHLLKKRAVVSQDLSGFMSAQRADNCTIRVQEALVREAYLSDKHLGEKNLAFYKKWKHHFKFDTLVAFYHKYKTDLEQDTPQADSIRLSLIKASKEFQTHTNKLFQPDNPHSLLTYQEAMQAHCTIKALQTRLSTIEDNLAEARKKDSYKLEWEQKQLAALSGESIKKVDTFIQEKVKLIESLKKSAVEIWSLSPRPVSDFSFAAKDLEKSLNILTLHVDNMKRTDSAGAIFQIEEIVKNIPFSKPIFWSAIPVQERPLVHVHLNYLMVTYGQLNLQPTSSLPERQNTALSLLAMIHGLALVIDADIFEQNPRLKNYGIFTLPFMLRITDPFLVSFDPSTFATRQKLLHYFQQFQGHALFNFSMLQNVKKYFNSFLDVNFLLSYIERVPGLRDKLDEEVEKIKATFTGFPIDALQAVVLLSNPSILDIKELKHLAFLKNAAFISQLFCGYADDNNRTAEPTFTIDSNINPQKKDEILIKYQYGNSHAIKWESSSTFPARKNHGLNHESYSELIQLLNSPSFERNRTEIWSEGNVVISFNTDALKKIKCDKLLAATNVKPTLQQTKLLYHFRYDHINELRESESQTIFDLLFFKPTFERKILNPENDLIKDEYVPAFDPSVMNEQLIHQCSEFLNYGITHFYLRQFNGKPITYACLFFIRLSQRLQAIHPTAAFPNLNHYLNEWLDKPLTSKEKSAIHLHRIHQYLSYPQSKIDLSIISEILTSWFYYCGEPLDPQWAEPQLEMRVRQFISSLAPKIEELLQNPTIFNKTFNEIFNICELENLDNHSQWTRIRGTLSFQLNQNGRVCWEVNLLTGTIADPTGVVRRGDSKAIASEDYYRRLFNETQFSIKKTGEVFYFKHPQYGQIRVIQKRTTRTIDNNVKISNIIIQRQQVEGVTGEWHQFIMPDEIMGCRLFPLALLADHSAWISHNGQISFCDLNTGRLNAVANREGLFLKTSFNDGNQLLYLPEQLESSPNLKLFENKHWLLLSMNGLKPNKIFFTRYNANNSGRKGQTLTFQFKEGSNEAVWLENLRFSLSADQPRGLLGRIPEYLVLHENSKTRNPKRKALVPMRPIEGNKYYHRHTHIIVETGKKQAEENQTKDKTTYTADDVMCNQSGIYRYLEYDIEGRQVKPLSTEGVLYLSYMHLCERNYEKMFALLNTVSSSATFSKESLEILQWMLAVEGQADMSPDASASRLHILLFINSLNERPNQKKEKNKSPSQDSANELKDLKGFILENYHQYLRTLSAVSQSLRLSREQEERIIEGFGTNKEDPKTNDQACMKRKAVLAASNPLEQMKPSASQGELTIKVNALLTNRLDKIIEERNYFEDEKRITGLAYIAGWERSIKHYQEGWLKELQFGCVGKNNSLQQRFGELYTLVRKNWNNPQERLALQLNFVFMQQKYALSSPHWRDIPNNLLLNLLHCALLFPKEVPDLPLQSTSLERKIEWFTQIIAFYFKKQGKFIEEHAKYNPSVPLIRQLDLQMPQKHLLLSQQPQVSHMPKQEANQSLIPAKAPSAAAAAPLQLNLLAETYFSISRKILDASPLLQFELSEKEVSEEEQVYFQAIKSELAEFRQEYGAGRKKNEARLSYKIKASLSALKQDLQKGKSHSKGLNTLENEIKQLEKIILDLANKRSEDDQKRLLENTLFAGNFSQSYSIEQLKNFLLLKGNREAFKKVNPLLSETEIDSMGQLLLIYTINSAELKQGKKALKLIEETEEEHVAENGSQEKIQSLLSDLAHTLHAKMHYSPFKYPIFLVFEERAGIRLRKGQVELLEQLLQLDPKTQKYKDVVKQLLMGEGKTAVLAPLLLYIAAMKSKISTYMGPPAQFNSVKQNLIATQKEYFGQDVIAIDLTREEFTEQNLQWMLTQLQEGIQKKENILLIKQTTIQSLCLQLVFSVLSVKKDQEMLSDGQRKEQANVISLLKQILKTYTDNSQVIKDESDVLLDENFEVNFPYGPPSKLNANYVELISAIYTILISELPVEGKPIKDIIQLGKNKQTDITTEIYKHKILPVVLEALAKSFSPLKIPEKYIPSFQRFAMGLLKPNKLQPIDREFLEYILKEHKSAKSQDIMAAKLTSLCKHLFRDILPFTLTRSTNRHYGRAGMDTAPGKICPYRGVDTRSSNEFISPLITSAYHFQTAIFQGTSIEQLKAIAAMMTAAAQHYCDKEKSLFNNTCEAREFEIMTGVSLGNIDLPGHMEKALAYLNQDINRVLNAEAETVCSIVTSYPNHLTSNSQDAVAFDNTVRAFSGTPYNSIGYAEKLRKNTHLDVGTSGQIIDEMLRRAAANPYSIHVVEEVTVASMFQEAAHSPRNKRIRGIVDPAGLFRNEKDNLAVARQLLDQFKNNDQIEYVLFFGRREPNAPPDDLMVLKKGFSEPNYLGVTKKEKLAEKGIDPIHACFFIDERHCEGTDLPLPQDALFLMTLDEKLYIRTVGQTALRERGYFDQQDLEYVVRKKAFPLFLGPVEKIYHEITAIRTKKPNDVQTMGMLTQELLKCFLITFAKNEAIAKSRIAFIAFKHKLDQPLRQKAFKALFNAPDLNTLITTCSTFESVFITDTIEDPFEKYFNEEEEIPSIAALQAYYNKKLVQLNKITHNEDTIKEITEEMDLIMAEARKCLFLPKTVSAQSNGEQLNNEQVLQIEMELNQNKEQELLLDQDMRQELDQYSQHDKEKAFKELPWTESMISRDFSKIDTAFRNANAPAIYSLFSLLSNSQETQVKYRHEYSKIFDHNILISRNLALTVTNFQPVFNPIQKPANQILMIAKGEELRAVMLSIHDADFFKEYLRKYEPMDMWLILPDGQEISFHKHKESLTLQFKRALIQINLFNGNAAYLDLHENRRMFDAFLKEKESALKLRFLRLKVESDKTQKEIFSKNSSMNPTGIKFNTPVADMARTKQQRLEEEGFENISEQEIQFLPEHKIPLLGGNKIPLLKKPEHIQALEQPQLRFILPEQVQYLSSFQIASLTEKEHINVVPMEFISNLNRSQLKLLSKDKIQQVGPEIFLSDTFPNEQVPNLSKTQVRQLIDPRKIGEPSQYDWISPTQVEDLSNQQLKFLPNADQIAAIPIEKFYLLSENQIKKASPSQVKLIPLDLINSLSTSAFQYLEGAERIQNVKPQNVPYLIHEEQIHLLADSQLVDITPEQIKKIKPEQVNHLRCCDLKHIIPEHVAYFNPQFLYYLETKEQIQAVDIINLKYLIQTQYTYLSIPQIEAIEGDKVPWLNGSQVKHLKTKEQIQHVEPQNIPSIVPEQVMHLTPKQIGLLNGRAQIEKVDGPNVRHLQNNQFSMITKAQIPHLTAEQVPFLSINQIDDLDDAQIKFLTSKAHIQHLGTDSKKLVHLQKSQFEHLSDNQLNAFPKGRIGELSLNLLKKLTNPLLIQAIPIKRVPKLAINQLPHLGKHQLASVPKSDYRYLRTGQLKQLYSKAQAVGLIVSGFFFNIARLVACVTGIYFLKYATKSCRKLMDTLDLKCGEFLIGLRVLC